MKWMGTGDKYRMYIRGIMQEKSPVNESFFKPETLDSIRNLIKAKEAEKSKADPLTQQGNLHRADRTSYKADESGKLVEWIPPPDKLISRAIRYEDYDPYIKDDGRFDEKATKARETLGQFTYKIDKQGNVIATDHYDFNATHGKNGNEKAGLDYFSDAFQKLLMGDPYEMAHAVGEYVVPSDGKHGYPVEINLGKMSEWNKSDNEKPNGPTLPAEMLAPVAKVSK